MSAELDALFEKNTESLVASLDKSVQKALQAYEKLNQVGQKSELSHIYISFLLSSVLCKLPWLRIDLYDENDRSDMTECYADYDVPCIADKLYRDADTAAKQIDRIKDYELERIWLETSGEYYQAFEKYVPLIIEKCPVSKKLNCEWHFGQYLGSVVTVREKN